MFIWAITLLVVINWNLANAVPFDIPPPIPADEEIGNATHSKSGRNKM